MFIKNRKSSVLNFALILALLGGLFGVVQVHAATLMVTNTNDSGPGSLRQAILDAAAGETITFDPTLAGGWLSLSSQLTINKNLTIDGSALNPPLTLSGGFTTRIIQANWPAHVTISGLILTNGSATSGNGGAVHASSFTAINSTFFDNSAAGNGGAIWGGTIKLINSSFSRNIAGGDGGAITGVNLDINNTTIHQNQAYDEGGAIAIYGDGTTTITNSTIFRNQAGSSGGGMFITGYPIVDILNSTFAENTAVNGHEFILGNIYHIAFANTIFVCNEASEACYVPAGNTILNTNSILGVGSLNDYGLSEPADHDGPTETMALLPDSPLIDAGDDSICANAPVNSLDQRGVSRLQGSHCDIGAYEDQFIVRYLKQDATGTSDGSSWINAHTDLQSALVAASPDEEIWVAAGTYKPTSTTDRTISFNLKNGVAVYGGFAGTETSSDQRDYEVNPTILSGDIGIEGNNSDNSYHVVVGSNKNNSALLDGFTVTAGNANLSQLDTGGGMLNESGGPTVSNVTFSGNSGGLGGGMYNSGDYRYPIPNGSSPILTNVIFSNNSALEGAGMENQFYSSPTLTNVSFINNTAIRSGGGMINYDHSSPTLTNVSFSGNTASVGGGIMNWVGNNPTLTNVTFHNNSATIDSGGGMVNYQSNPSLTNVTFSNNSASKYGGGIFNDNNSNPILTNVTFSGNSAIEGGGIYILGGNVNIHNSILYSNSGGEIYDYFSGTHVVTNSIVQGGYPGTGNIDADPLLGSLGDNGGFTQTMALQSGSPAIDAGDDVSCSSTDQRGVTRPQGSHCDIGAYEDQTTVRYVKWNAIGANDGTSWADAYTDLQSALSSAISGDEIWVVAGTYKPIMDTDRTISFTLKNGVAIYGGFVGTETLLTQRDFQTNVTLLNGDIGAVDDNSDNSYHVVVGSNTNNSAMLDGFTITDGNANNPSSGAAHKGGGMYNINGNPTLTNLIFTNNSAVWGGGIANDDQSSPILTNVTFSYNATQSETDYPPSGGGMFNTNSSPSLVNVAFHNNSAEYGGGLFNNVSSSPTLMNVTMSNNIASIEGGAIANSGTPVIRNSILWGNTGGELLNINSGATAVTNSIVQGGYPGTGNLDADPLLGPLANNGGFTQTMALSASSPAIDAGDDGNCPDTDQRGVTRPQGSRCDVGAYEYEPTFAAVQVDIAGNNVGNYDIPFGESAFDRYGINGGPVLVSSTDGTSPILASQRAIFGSSFNSILGYPANQLTTEYWFTSYDDVGMLTYLVIGNPDPTLTAEVDVYIGGNKMNPSGPYQIAPGQRIFPRYGINSGPVRVVSANGVNIFTSERTKYKDSFNEVMGYPVNQLATKFWFTSYDDLGMLTYLVIGNPDPTLTAEVDVYIGGNKMNPSGPYQIVPGQRIFPRYGINSGPVQVVSTNGVEIFASERTKFKDAFNEVMGYAGDQVYTEFWFTSYDDAGMMTYLVVGNPNETLTAEVDVYIAGVKQNTSGPIQIAPGQRFFHRYGINNGPVRVVSTNGVDIFASERSKYLNSFNEILGMAGNQLTTDYWFTSYDDLGMQTQLVISSP